MLGNVVVQRGVRADPERMALADSLKELDALFEAHEFTPALDLLHALPETADYEELLSAMISRVGHDHPVIGAHFALVGGGLVQEGAPTGALGRAIVRPFGRAMIDAMRLLDRSADLPDEPDAERSVVVGDKTLSEATLDVIAAEDEATVRAWRSLDLWYRPAVATWTRDLSVLRDVQRDGPFRHALAPLVRAADGMRWVSTLAEALIDDRLVFLFPELEEEAWMVSARGVLDMETAIDPPFGRARRPPCSYRCAPDRFCHNARRPSWAGLTASGGRVRRRLSRLPVAGRARERRHADRWCLHMVGARRRAALAAIRGSGDASTRSGPRLLPQEKRPALRWTWPTSVGGKPSSQDHGERGATLGPASLPEERGSAAGGGARRGSEASATLTPSACTSRVTSTMTPKLASSSVWRTAPATPASFAARTRRRSGLFAGRSST